MNIIVRLYVGFAIAILLVLGVGVISYNTFQRQAEESKWVQHTYKVMQVTGRIQNLTFDMEASRRGFRLTNQQRFLDGYNNALPQLPVAIEELKNLVRDNPDQLRRAAALQNNTNELISFYKNLGYATGTYDEGKKAAITITEKNLVAALKNDITRIFGAEERLLAQREQVNDKLIKNSILTLMIGIPLILLIVIILIVVILSEFKNRKKAQGDLRENLNQLRVLNKEANARNWQLAGVSKINNSLQGADDLESLAKAAVEVITEYIEVPAGALYFHNEEHNELKLLGAIGISASNGNVLKTGEGIVGAAASKRNVTIIKDVPKNYWKIQSATGASAPDTIVFLPLWLKDEMKGIIEIGMFNAEGEEKIELLKVVMHNIALAVDAADASAKVNLLLSRVQEQKEILESQQEELRQTNEELTRQSEILQASEEELRVQEEELRQINAELEERNEAVEVARQALFQRSQELEQSSKYKSEFLANMSHELRTPLNSILILAKLLSDNKASNLTEKQTEYAKIIHKSGNDLLNLINDILDLSKIEAGKIEMTFEPVAIKDLKLDVQQMFQALADEKGISLVVKSDDNVPEHITIDRQRLQQVVKNLMSNAMKFTPRSGTVTTHMSVSQDNQLEIAVTDTGIGIAPQKQQLIFEAFQQADGSTSRKYGGTGLGLSISKELIRRLGGEIKLKSEEGQGSTFTILLPLSKSDKVVRDLKPAEPMPDTVDIKKPLAEQTKIQDDRGSIVKGDKLILIVEDDMDFARLVKNFAHDKGYKAIVAMAGDEGLYYARKYLPSAIILDMGLPVLDGRSVLKMLKSDEKLKSIPVHIISGEEKSKLSVIGAEGFSQKPLDMAGLESAFDSIGGIISANYKHILFVSTSSTLNVPELYEFSGKRNMDLDYETVPDIETAIRTINARKYDCIVVDSDENVAGGIEKVRSIRQAADGNIVIFAYLRTDVTPAEEVELQKYADAIIRRSSFDRERLMDELELFLFKIKESEMIPVPKGVIDITDKGLDNKRVLVVDDDMRNVFALSTLLEEQGMQVLTAGDGKEALEQLKQDDGINIVLMDIMMPEMDGYTAMRHIREEKKYKDLPVIALTAKAMAEDREKCIAAGASDYITKPVDSNKLLSLMRVWLSK
ncbi:MAG: response regulator [Sphingobacteriales bacterium]|nr:MAG: response regulator [Sphingobacteriales bacterium]